MLASRNTLKVLMLTFCKQYISLRYFKIFSAAPFFNNALMTFVVAYWSVSREVTGRHSTYGGDNVILLHKAPRSANSCVAPKAFSWLVKYLSREGDIIADVNSSPGGAFAAALQQGRNAVWLSTATPDD